VAPVSAARIESDGKVRQLDGKAEPAEVFNEEDAKDSAKVARQMARLLREVAALRRQYVTRRIDFEDVTVGSGGASVTLEHGFGGRVVWWVVDWADVGGVSHNFAKSPATTDNTLVLYSYISGTATIRVEAAG
jgi:hypothetical protein